LWLAVLGDYPEVVDILLRHGADTEKGRRVAPLDIALFYESAPVIDTLIQAGAACDVNTGNVDSVLEKAIRNDVPAIVDTALTMCVTPDYLLYGDFPIQWVAKYFEAES